METHFLLGHAPMEEREAMMISPLRLAFVGDAVHALLVRTGLVFAGGKVGAMHRDAVQSVNAAAQADALGRIAGQLSETEASIVRRGRNAHAKHQAPRRARLSDYKQSTGLEALFGFLYLTGQYGRLQALYLAMQAAPEALADETSKTGETAPGEMENDGDGVSK